jgi:hypothetical protein
MESQLAIQTAIGQAKAKPRGLMKFFKQNSHEEYNKQVRRHAAEEDEFAQDQQEKKDVVDRRCTEKARDGGTAAEAPSDNL